MRGVDGNGAEIIQYLWNARLRTSELLRSGTRLQKMKRLRLAKAARRKALRPQREKPAGSERDLQWPERFIF